MKIIIQIIFRLLTQQEKIQQQKQEQEQNVQETKIKLVV